MRISIDASLGVAGGLELEVQPGVTAREILATVGLDARPWCGPIALSLDHTAGTYPLFDGARLTASAAEPCVAPIGPHLAVIAGPDAGALIPLDAPRALGRAAASGSVDDPAMSRHHGSARFAADAIVVRDAGSTNGIGTAVRTRPWGGGQTREVRLHHGETVRIGDTWLQARGLASPSDITPGGASGADNPGRRASIMVGAGVSAVMLAAVTGRWYLALIALIYPAITLAPTVLRRLQPPRTASVIALPDPTLPGSTPAHLTVAVCGIEPARTAFARAEILARGRRPPPHPGELDEPWMAWLPPARAGDGAVVLADQPPSWATRTVQIDDRGIQVVTDGHWETCPAALGVSAARADTAARRIAASHHRMQLPPEVRWADLEAPTLRTEGPRVLAAPLGVYSTEHGGTETWMLDLDAHGPHVLVAGTTGSGKSALLETLILSLCERWSPDDLRLALFDFKGGAGLARCSPLPHVAGHISDLDGRQARRALAALGAELAERKAQLAAAGHTSFAQWEEEGGAPARLVVVVDEFQEIGATLREFLPELTRLAAQGRSLGMHLILATQRPSGAVTPDIRANTGVTIALRVASEAESRDLVGTGAAAAIPPDAPGRGIVAWGHSRIEIQVALPIATRTPAVRLAGASDPTEPQHLAELVLQQHAHCARSQPLWHAPLPAHIDCLALQGTRGIPMGIADHAASRSRSTLEWIPQLGPLAVVGTPGRERTAALECAAAGASAIGCVAVWLPSDPRRAARTLALSHGRPDVVLLLEDVTKTLAVLSAVDRGAAAEALIARASGGGALAFGIGAGAPHRIAANASLRLVLAGASPHDDALWSVPRELQGLAHEPFLARAHDAHGWREARIAEAATASHECLAKPLPAHVDREQLASARGVGIGGDAAREIVLRPDVSVTVVGVPGTERDNAVAVLQAAGAQSVQCADAPILMPPRARDGIVVATEPTPRIAEELCRGITGGLVEPTTLPGRVLWVDAGVGACVQLVSLAHVSAPVSN